MNTAYLSFDYTYDKSNRLLNTVGLSSKSFDLENTYDKDGNIMTLKRYGSTGTLDDNFTYTYYSGTNRLQKVYGSTSQYTYDANGNIKTDEVNRNSDIKYDNRNLIIQIRNKKIAIEDSLVYLTYYYYDDAGNRIRKKVYQYIGIQQPDSVASPDTEDIGDAPSIWELINDEIYSRGVDGKELAIYLNGNLKQNNIWGLGNEGYITNLDFPNFYVKDYLGSIRAITDENNSVISAQDYDAWGFLLQSRTYESDESIYKFTGKERDKENNYDYFGARYYDARIGNWISTDPLMEKHIDYSPYNYVLRNPFKLIDPDGRQTVAIRMFAKEVIYKSTRIASPVFDIPITPLDVFLQVFMGNLGTMDVKENQSIFVVGEEGYLEYDQPIDEINITTLETRSKDIKKIVVGKMDPVQKHLDLLEGKTSKYPGPPHKQDKEKWKTDIQRNWNQAKEKALKIGKSVQQILKQMGWSEEKISSLLERIKKQGIEP
ncbi:MAG: hypothetical protein HGGPFJEG_02439 [Ignavibacteria bacterium]|nr:hypothetical protein [Ignavibacteria bacterium]